MTELAHNEVTTATASNSVTINRERDARAAIVQQQNDSNEEDVDAYNSDVGNTA